jgi:hypothetical protein
MSRHHREWATAWSVGRILQQKWPLPEALAKHPDLMKPGRDLHEWTCLHDTGSLFPEPDPEIAGFATAWKRFSYAFSPSWSIREGAFEVLASDTIPLGFHGIVDACGSVRGKLTVCDLKTGNPTEAHPIQLALYTMGLFPKTAHAGTIQRLNVYVTKDGTYRAVLRDDPRDFILAHELLTKAKESV